MTTLSRLQRIAATPLDDATQHTRLVVDTTSDSITLPEGVYTLINGGAVTMFLRVGGAATVPADKAALASGFALTAGASVQFHATAERVLHAIVASDTADLLILKQAV